MTEFWLKQKFTNVSVNYYHDIEVRFCCYVRWSGYCCTTHLFKRRSTKQIEFIILVYKMKTYLSLIILAKTDLS